MIKRSTWSCQNLSSSHKSSSWRFEFVKGITRERVLMDGASPFASLLSPISIQPSMERLWRNNKQKEIPNGIIRRRISFFDSQNFARVHKHSAVRRAIGNTHQIGTEIRCCRNKSEVKNYEFKKEIVERRITNPEKRRLPVLSHITNSFLCFFTSSLLLISHQRIMFVLFTTKRFTDEVLEFPKTAHLWASGTKISRVANRSKSDIKSI